MGKQRMIDTDFWSDTWVVDQLNIVDRYLFIYLFTNPHTNVAGVYELSLRIMAFETGLETNELATTLRRLDPKVKYVDGWVILKNGIKNQNYKNEKMKRGIEIVLERVPSEVLQHVYWPKDFGIKKPEGSKQIQLIDDLSIGHVYPAGNNNYNSNYNNNSNAAVPAAVGLTEKQKKRQYAIAMDIEREQKAKAEEAKNRKGNTASLSESIGHKKARLAAEKIKNKSTSKNTTSQA